MKLTLLLITCAGLVTASNLLAQPDTTAIKSGWGSLNYAVPESPAFKILNVAPNHILRPGTTRDIALAIGNYVIANGAAIPKNIAIEVAPSAFSTMNLSDYNSGLNRLWYTSAFSMGTKVNTDGSYDISAGYKVRILDDADMRNNKTFNNFISSIGKKFPDALEAATKTVAAQQNMIVPLAVDAYGDTTNPKHNQIKQAIDAEYSNLVYNDIQLFLKYKEAIKDSLWNAPVWDVGMATLFSSKDSLIKSLSSNPAQLGLWTTFGSPLPFGILPQTGQILIGATLGLTQDSTQSLSAATVDLGARVYFGSNDLKGFFEYELLTKNNFDAALKSSKVSIGLETTFFGGLWISASVGIQKTGIDDAVFTQGISISFATPEPQ